MKTKTFLLFCLLAGCIFYSCDNDDDHLAVPEEYPAAFYSLYPDAKGIEWEKKGEYFVADFWRSDMKAEAEAWFNSRAEWQMTVTEILYDSLPSEVKNSFQSSEYSRWYLDDTDLVERYEKETLYVIEVKKGDREYDLYFSSDGKLLQEMPSTNDKSNFYLSN
ncbi:MAG: PepSY-like domain-containing protein [Bacteroidales bacterium]|nr:PepSY-like domain-containing protein [Bacteroidales bacterium]